MLLIVNSGKTQPSPHKDAAINAPTKKEAHRSSPAVEHASEGKTEGEGEAQSDEGEKNEECDGQPSSEDVGESVKPAVVCFRTSFSDQLMDTSNTERGRSKVS
jgi:hypothetical protein